ncbi:hypothetical protein DICA1_B08922 [Diutina catenulata]
MSFSHEKQGAEVLPVHRRYRLSDKGDSNGNLRGYISRRWIFYPIAFFVVLYMVAIGLQNVNSFWELPRGDYSDDTKNPDATSEYIGVQYPAVQPNWGKPVFSKKIIDHKYVSFGEPGTYKYTPKADFTNAVLTLDIDVDKIQYDRLINVFIGDVQVWRSSTIEPGGKAVHSSTEKDISQYAALLRNEAKIVVQLDNQIKGTLTGEIRLRLKLDLYKAPDKDESDLGKQLFSSHRPADHVYGLVATKNQFPVANLPQDKFEVGLPEVSRKTTSLKLVVHASGNSKEEDWYTNVLDKHTDVFEEPMLGHGPVRFVEVSYDGQLVGRLAPKPVIFTGGVSPALWRPVVSNTAFDLPILEFNLTPLLPKLWKANKGALKNKAKLKIEVVSGVESGIGSDWITSASLHAFEHPDVEDVSGELLKPKVSFDYNPSSYTRRQHLFQEIHATSSVELAAKFKFKFKDGNKVAVKHTVLSMATINNGQAYLHSGESTSISVLTDGHDHVTVVDDNDDVVYELKNSHTYSLSLESQDIEPAEGDTYAYKIDLTDHDQRLVEAKDMTHKIDRTQSGTSQYNMNPKRNYGTGKSTTTYRMDTQFKRGCHVFEREAVADRGQIISDESRALL